MCVCVCVCACVVCTHAGVHVAVDRCVFLLTAVINGEHPWLGTKLLLNSLTFCVIASGQFAEEVRGSNGIRLEKYNYHFTYKGNHLWAALQLWGGGRGLGLFVCICVYRISWKKKISSLFCLYMCSCMLPHCVRGSEWKSVWKDTLSLWLWVFLSPLSLPRVYHGGLPWQPQKWPVRALGNVDVQIMTCWKPWTTSLSPAGNWFFYQFIVSSCTAHHWYSYFRNRRRVREKETEINMNIFTCVCAHTRVCIWFGETAGAH